VTRNLYEDPVMAKTPFRPPGRAQRSASYRQVLSRTWKTAFICRAPDMTWHRIPNLLTSSTAME